EARGLGEAAPRECPRPDEGHRGHRWTRPALRGQLDGPLVLPVYRAPRGPVPDLAGRHREDPDGGRDRFPALLPDAAVQTEGPPRGPRTGTQAGVGAGLRCVL